jgi:hypothetical protein
MNGTRSNRFRTTSVCVFYLTTSLACVALAQTQAGRAPPLPRELNDKEGNRLAQQRHLLVPKNAKETKYVQGPQGEWLLVAYRLSERYPAKATLAELASHFKGGGWKPMKEDWLNPGIPSSHAKGWSEFVDGTVNPPLRVWQWKGAWENAQGDIIDYSLTYYGALRGSGERSDLSISGAWFSAAEAAKRRRVFGIHK